jgi:single-strand DNA-binding protein
MLNRIILAGNVGSAPEVRYYGSGEPRVVLRLATSDKWTDKQSGEPKEETTWHRLVLHGSEAKFAAEYVEKGDLIYVEGKQTFRQWEDEAKQKQYCAEVRVSKLQKLSSGKGGHSGDRAAQGGDGKQKRGVPNPGLTPSAPPLPPKSGQFGPGIDENDRPF